MTDSGQIYENYSSEKEIKARRVKVKEVKGYNSKIISAGKDLVRRSPKTWPVLSRLRPTVDTALIPLCNTRFIKGHKPSNHIRARIKSHVYTTEWTVYHSTYHVKRHNKANTNVIYYINDKMSDTAEAKYNKYDKSSPKLKQGATGTSTGRRMPRKLTDPLKGSPPPPFIDSRRDGYMYRGSRKSSCSSRAVGIQVAGIPKIVVKQ